MEIGEITLPSGYDWYDDQIAGHRPTVIKNGERELGIIKQLLSDRLLKPVQTGCRGTSEISVYESVTQISNVKEPEENAQNLREFSSFLPKYYGVQTLNITANGVIKEIECIAMEDLVHSYILPCIMDVKMGKITYDPNAPRSKVLSETTKYPEQEKLGFRLLGYRMHCCNNEVKIQDKLWGRTRTMESIGDALEEFLMGRSNAQHELVSDILSHLYKIRSWFQKQALFHMYASSILLVYEASLERTCNVRVKLIDFSHVFPANDQIDSNYLFGLLNIIRFLEGIKFHKEIK